MGAEEELLMGVRRNARCFLRPVATCSGAGRDECLVVPPLSLERLGLPDGWLRRGFVERSGVPRDGGRVRPGHGEGKQRRCERWLEIRHEAGDLAKAL